MKFHRSKNLARVRPSKESRFMELVSRAKRSPTAALRHAPRPRKPHDIERSEVWCCTSGTSLRWTAP